MPRKSSYSSGILLSLLIMKSGCGYAPNPDDSDFDDYCESIRSPTFTIILDADATNSAHCFEQVFPGSCRVWIKEGNGFQLVDQEPTACVWESGISADGQDTLEFHDNAERGYSFLIRHECGGKRLLMDSSGQTKGHLSSETCQNQ